MKKHRMKATNSVSLAKWNTVKLTHTGNTTTNSVITSAMFKRESAEYDAGILHEEHDLYLGERYE